MRAQCTNLAAAARSRHRLDCHCCFVGDIENRLYGLYSARVAGRVQHRRAVCIALAKHCQRGTRSPCTALPGSGIARAFVRAPTAPVASVRSGQSNIGIFNHSSVESVDIIIVFFVILLFLIRCDSQC